MQAEAAWSAIIAGAMLRRGAMVHAASSLLTLAALLGPAAASIAAAKLGAAWLGVAAAIVLLGLVEFWLAARVALDSELFDAIAKSADLEGFDHAMQALALMPADKAGRSLGLRIRGALRLLKLQGLMFVAQVAALIAGVLWA
jgi:hypothetical protein